jgi:outer membrane protein
VRGLPLALLSLLATAPAAADGPGGTPVSPAAPMLAPPGGADPCMPAALSTPLTLGDAVSRALCANPRTRVAWASIKLYAAEVRTGKESYLPSLSASAKETESNTQTKITHDPALNTIAHDNYPAGTVSLSWVLYDFGQRGDQLESARQLLAAARANLDRTLQLVFLRAAADYYDAQAAQASLDAALQIESLTQRSLDAAHARTERGVAPISDELQAQTAHAQAVLTRVKAEGELKAKRGALALDMGLDPDSTLTVPPADLTVSVRRDFTESLHQLIAEAKRNHPSVAQAESELAAARADERAARAHGYPTISIVGGLSRSNEPLTPSLGSPTVPGSVSNKSIGLEVNVPISDPLWKRGLVAQAHARVAIQQEVLNGAEQEVAASVWSSYTTLEADTDNLANSQALLDSARKSFEAAQHRYEGGAGGILELLTSQTAYANAQQQRIQSLSDWRIARLSLGASLGRLGLWALEGAQ